MQRDSIGQQHRRSPNLRSAHLTLPRGRAMSHLSLDCAHSWRVFFGVLHSSVQHLSTGAIQDADDFATYLWFGGHLGAVHPILLLRQTAAWQGRFRLALTIAREVRLCLQPGGLLRVQSLHLPSWAWLGVIYAAD